MGRLGGKLVSEKSLLAPVIVAIAAVRSTGAALVAGTEAFSAAGACPSAGASTLWK